jgi:hypothetical protein
MPLSTERDTPAKGTDIRTAPLAAATRIFKGALGVLNAAGKAVPGAVALNLIPLGRARETFDNSAGAADAVTGEFDVGTFLFRNLAGDPVLAADLGKDCFIADDDAVARTNGTGTRSVAGKVRGVEPAGVWVEIA